MIAESAAFMRGEYVNLKKWTQALENNHEGNKGYSKPIMKLGEIPNINDYDAEDSNYKIPQDIIDNPLEWLGPLPEKYQKKADNKNDDWFLDFVKKSGMPFAPPPPKNFLHHKPKKKSPSYSNKFRKKRK